MNNTRFRSTKYDLRSTIYFFGRHVRGDSDDHSLLKLIIAFLLFPLIFPVYGQMPKTNLPVCVQVGFHVTDSTFPEHWLTAKINATATPLSISETDHVLEILSHAFSKYPEKVICKYLKQVYIFKRMQFYNVPFGGTSYKGNVYLTDDEENLNCSYDLLENFFHHEFSSVLLLKNKCKLEKRKWIKLNPENFQYGKGGLDAILSGNAEMTFDPVLNERGFLTHYSEASLEEDFNVYCQNIFNGGAEFWRLVEKYPKIKSKTLLVIHFYNRIHPLFSENFFKTIQ